MQLLSPSQVPVDEENFIDRELKKISSNLQTFTVDHFNQLRSHIESIGFQKAANKAVKEFNLATIESYQTVNSSKHEMELMTVTGGGPNIQDKID